LKAAGVDIRFWRLAMRPGKPMMHGVKGGMRVLGLPGNPASAFVCGVIFLAPLIRALSGRLDIATPLRAARWAVDWKANDERQDYVRASLTLDARTGVAAATPLAMQDSSLSAMLQKADCLIVRTPFAPAAKAGDLCEVINLR